MRVYFEEHEQFMTLLIEHNRMSVYSFQLNVSTKGTPKFDRLFSFVKQEFSTETEAIKIKQ